jgi:hypothetical protein
MTKQFKIGECAVGGIIKINTESKNNLHTITIAALDWYSKQELFSATFRMDDERKIDNYLNELTTSYYSDKIINYIKNKK